ncbi:hypothetical protein VOLCADRAFT_91558 [Volvox carteri f. nagariensis]|uniref:Ricin B lectin domain-containing protein n=1 Tax=Volvox carteri f. nagariensis TaxID=3068 RepID=D8TXE0_VOLCA|nr:uncharacterized protein VOLCADRAFT_91558 [Volvox carteri f. nagariensis]EFJ47893.1 hypothetical protein VOLCADRAFT_91558 [Volvox carteri f. nagariensis]|eukprot:XP_002950999.1 hypothetical protein VOLCADRAFT_91558 [Volvox carteri f. nagariensis]
MDCVYDSASQEFMLSTLDNGWALRPKYDTSLCLDVQWSGAADGTPIQVWECNRTPAQKFLIPAFRPVFQKVLHYEPWPISGNVCIDSQSGSLLHGAGCSSSSPSQQFIFAREGIDGTYRILSGQDWSQCWTIPVVPSLPDWDPEPLAYPVTLTPCSFDIFSQGFIIHEEVPRFGAWILEARGARGKCADVVQGTVVITPCDYSVTQHFNLPGFSLS